MVNASQINSSPRTVKIGDRELLLSPLTDADVGMLEAWVRDRIVELTLPTFARLDDADRQRQTDRLFDRVAEVSIFSPEAMRHLSGPVGAIKSLWLAIRKMHPDVTEAWLSEQMIDQAAIAEAVKRQQRLEREQFPKFTPAAQAKPKRTRRRR